jgi:hypothetical protein
LFNSYGKSVFRLIAASLCLIACNASALTVRLCTFDRPFAPYTMPDGSGQTQELLRRAARGSAIRIENTFAPRARCLAQLQHGETDALVAAYAPERVSYGAIPMLGGQPDQSYALAVTRFMVYRRSGSAVQWNGKQFSGLGTLPVGVQASFIHGPLLQKLGVTVDDGAKSADQNLGKLAFDRLSAAIAQEAEAGYYVEQNYKGRIEALPIPFNLTPLYLMVNRGFYKRNRAAIDGYWQTIRTVRQSPEYQAYLRQWR